MGILPQFLKGELEVVLCELAAGVLRSIVNAEQPKIADDDETGLLALGEVLCVGKGLLERGHHAALALFRLV